MKVRIMKLFISDIRFIARRPLLLTALFSPVIISLFLLSLFPHISGLARYEDAFSWSRYYSVIAVTLISAIPCIYGLLFSFIHLYKLPLADNNKNAISAGEPKWLLKSRIAAVTFLTFGIVLPVIFLTNPVDTEGWVRSIYAAFLLAIMAPFIFLFTACFGCNRKKWKLYSLISLTFLITVPTGLLVHHPWNYLEFFSPFYWLSWAWVIGLPAESLMYGSISLAIAVVSMLFFYRSFLRYSGRV